MSETPLANLILLHPDDNILVCVRQICAGDAITIDQETLTAVPWPQGTRSTATGLLLAR